MSGKETQSPSSGDAATSHVDVNYFNPDGDEGLRRTISRMSAATQDIEQTGSSETLNAFDLRKVLEQVAEQREKVNLKSRELGVMFENLRVVGLGATASHQPTLGSTLNPLGIVEGIQAARHPHTRDILSGFEGVVYPGEMLLVLGRPGSGCTTLLKTLANQRGEYHAFEGDVHFDSLSHRDIFKNYRGDVVYCPEDDVHFPTLTVEQTIKFAAKLRAPHLRLGYSREDYAEHITELLTTVFGLKHARKTLVGDATVRGVSGGEKKRVSISEVLATRACVASWDNSTRGLDASTALEFVRALRIATDIAKMTTVVSLYQAGESLYKLFDKVCVIYEGKMAYYGPANEARSYFIDLGYEPANRQTTADFLVAVTDPNGRIPRSDALHLPRTADEFATHFQASAISKWNKTEIQRFKAERVGKADMVQSYKESAREDHSKHTRLGSAHLTSLPMQARAVMIRRIQILRGNLLATVLNLFSFLFQGIIIGSVYLKMSTSTSAYFSRGGVLFFALFFSALISMAEIPALYAQRPIILRQHSWALYHPFIDQVALVLVDIPMALASSVIFSVLIYEMAQLQQSAGQFFIFFLFMFVVSITMKSWFRAVASAFAAEALAQTFAGISVLAYAVYTGYSLPLPSMIGALKWISYLNPLRWGFESVMTNEFRSINGSCGSLVPRGEGYEGVSLDNQVCPVVGAQPGQAFVDGNAFAYLSYDYRFSHTWRNFGIIIAFLVAYTAALLIFTEVNTKLTSANSVVLFKRGAKTDAVPKKNTDSDDTEKASQITTRGGGLSDEEKSGDYDKALKATPSVTDVFSWQHLTYTVPVADGKRRLLNDVSGFVAPGKLTALMGESGAGKTTLLNVLAERANIGVITGDRFVNGHALPKDFQSQTGYCQQQDTHVGSATVREALLFSAQLRQPTSVPLSEKVEYVEKCIQLCGLEPFRDATVGSLSIENRKRTTIGVELAAKPKLLLFLDEPTSGLDSQSAWAIMLFLRDLADNGQAILCTIHQPSAELFQMFDRLLLLRKGGETVYFGDLGHNATTLIDYFQAHGSRRCEPEENPAEFMLDVIGAGASATSREDWHEIWCNSDEFTKVQGQIQEIHAKGRSQPAVGTTLHSEYATSWFHQVVQLVKRDASDHFRDPSYMMAKMALNIVSGLFLGFSFFKSKDTQQGTQNKLFSIFMSTIISVPLANQLQIPFLNMRSIYEIRERPSRMYNWTALVTSQILVEVPWNIIGSSLYFFCWYWTSGFTSDRAGYSYLMIGVIFPLYYTTIGQSVAAMSPNAEIAAILFSFLFSFVLTFNGVVQPYRELGWWKWMYRLSPYTYLIEGVLGQAVGRQQVTCSSVELVTLNPPAGQTCGQYMQNYILRSGGYLTNPDASSSCGFCSTRTTDEFLTNNFNIFYSHHWRNVGLMAAFILFNIAAIFAFTFWFRIRTRSVLDMIRRLFLRTLAECGITHAFVNWGSDHPALLEELERQRIEDGKTSPFIVTCPNEMVALSSAQGYAQVTGKPAAVIVHVDVGTQALAGAIHNVDRGQTPVLIYAGASAFTSNGELKGSRNEWIMWIQDIPDQAAIVRQYMRHTAQINSSHNVAEVVKRSLQIATSHPKGPVYLWGRREVMEAEVDASVLDAAGHDLRQWPSVEATALSPKALTAIATALMKATNPLIITSSLGRNVDAVEPLLALSTLLAIPIVITCPSVVNVPFSHPFLDSISYLNPSVPIKRLADADAILVIDSDLPWIPTVAKPSDKARVFVVSGADPLKASSIGSWHVAAEMICQADAQVALTQIVERVSHLDEQQRRSVGEQILGSRIVQDRRQLLKDAHTAWLDGLEDRERDFSGVHLTVPNIIGGLRRAIELYTSSRGMETLVLSEAISNYGAVWEHLRPKVLGSVLTSGGSALGWALGASVGAYLGGKVKSHQVEGARPYELVVAIVGDGSFMFGVPSSAYWMARKYGTPFLTIVLNNGGWKSPKLSMLGVYPSGLGSQAIGERLSVGFGPEGFGPDSPDFSQIAVAASGGWAWGKRVAGSDATALEEVLAEAVNVVVKERRCAILDCILESI